MNTDRIHKTNRLKYFRGTKFSISGNHIQYKNSRTFYRQNVQFMKVNAVVLIATLQRLLNGFNKGNTSVIACFITRALPVIYITNAPFLLSSKTHFTT